MVHFFLRNENFVQLFAGPDAGDLDRDAVLANQGLRDIEDRGRRCGGYVGLTGLRFLEGRPGDLIELLADDVSYHLPGLHLGGGRCIEVWSHFEDQAGCDEFWRGIDA